VANLAQDASTPATSASAAASTLHVVTSTTELSVATNNPEDETASANTIEIASRSTIKDAIARASAPVEEQSSTIAVEPTAPGEVAPDPADLLDALRKKRLERETAANDELPHKATGASRPLIPLHEPEPVTSSIKIINDEPLVEAEDSQLPAVEPEDLLDDFAPSTLPVEVVAEPAAEAKTETKRGRAGIPSWDEIVFGTKTEE
jgi:hypothetical protein